MIIKIGKKFPRVPPKMGFRVPVKPHESLGETVIQVSDNCIDMVFEKALISRFISLNHRRARPPLWPLRTITPFEKHSLYLIFSMRFFFDFISNKKTSLGLQRLT